MKDLLISLILTAILILLFSGLPVAGDMELLRGGIVPEHPGVSGMVLPGGGADMAEASQKTEARGEEPHEAPDGSCEAEKEIQTETKMEVQSNMDGMLFYWQGVATVLIGETVALMIAAAWMKIYIWMKSRGGGDGKG